MARPSRPGTFSETDHRLPGHLPAGAKYWPEFAANGKQDVTVSQVLSHSSGVSGLEHPAVIADLVIIMDAGRRMAVSYMMNKMGAGVVGSQRSSGYG